MRGRVDEHRDIRDLGRLGQFVERGRVDDLVGHHDVANAHAGQHHRFPGRLAAYGRHPVDELQPGEGGAFVGLEMRPQHLPGTEAGDRSPVVVARRRHVDDQRRGRDVLEEVEWWQAHVVRLTVIPRFSRTSPVPWCRGFRRRSCHGSPVYPVAGDSAVGFAFRSLGECTADISRRLSARTPPPRG